jgi:hypothetical protein
MRIATWTGLLLLAAATAASAQRLRPPFGSEVRLNIGDTTNLKGELLAVDRDSIWVLYGPQHERLLARVPLAEVSEVRVDRGGMGPGAALAWSLIAGVVSGAALQSACSSVGGDCGEVLPITLLVWGLVGATSAASLQSTRYQTLPPEPDSLRARARFPQGLPPGFPPDR